MFESFFRRKNDEEAMRDNGRLPPGQSLTQRFPVLHYGPVPPFNPEKWDFQIWGEVEQPLRLNWEEFSQLPRSTIQMDLHCVTHWSKFDMLWEGVSVRSLVDQGLLKIKANARYVIEHAEYDYRTNLPLRVVLQENFLLATHYDGHPLEPEHGCPLRGIIGAIPGREDLVTPYLWKGAKWLRGLEFVAQDQPGFWEQAGYHNEADVWKEERFS